MKKLFFFLSVLLCLTSCSDEIANSAEIDVPTNENPAVVEPEMRTIRIAASTGGSGKTRTTLSGHSVLWDENDEFVVANPQQDSPSKTLLVTVNGTDQALGIQADDNTNALIKYDYIKVVVNGQDITSDIVSESTDDNAYLLGITNTTDNHYQFAPAGKTVSAQTNSYRKNIFSKYVYTIPLVRSSSKSSFSDNNKAIVTLRDIKYSLDKGSTWNDVDEGTTLRNGSSWNHKDVSFFWVKNSFVDMKLEYGAGQTSGTFIGNTSDLGDIDDQTIAVYPSQVMQNYSGNRISVSLPETQTYVECSFDHKANVMMGNLYKLENDSYDVSFKNMMGILQLKFKGEGDINTIAVTDKGGRKLWGIASVEAADLGTGINTDMVSGGSSTIILNCNGVSLSNDEEKVFNIVVPVGAFENGMDIEVKSKNGTTYNKSTTVNNRIIRSDIKKMPTLSVEIIDSYPLENEAVVKYFSYGPYQNYGDKSYLTTYSSAFSKMYDHDDPLSVPLSWTGDASKNYIVTLTYQNDEGVNTSKTYTTTGTAYSAYNLVPGKKYSYTVKDGDSVIKSSAFFTTGQVRMVTIEDSWNYRDIGGWTGLNGNKIKYEWIYRGGSLNGVWQRSKQKYSKSEISKISNYKFSSVSRQQVEDLGIMGELDLRSLESQHNNSSDWSHSTSLGTANTGLSDWNFFQIMTTGASAPLTNYSVIKDVAWVINEVINNKRPVAFHCKSGADRTGMVGIALEALLGVAPGDLARDYELTNFSSEQGVVTGTKQLRDRKADDTSKEAYSFHKAIFKDDKNNPGTTYQEKMYYYLNKKFESQGIAISSLDLDRFIKFMLGLASYSHPTWATENGNTLESIFNSSSNSL